MSKSIFSFFLFFFYDVWNAKTPRKRHLPISMCVSVLYWVSMCFFSETESQTMWEKHVL
jgi:hypothetical protein